MNPKISVIIPVYNGRIFIKKALRSVLRQTYPAHEIIVIDDGSKDDTRAILDSYGDRIIVRTIKNCGCGGARNVGIGIATGDYMAFLDADDYWFRRRLEKIAEAIRRYPDAGFLCSNYVGASSITARLCKHYPNLPNAAKFNFDAPLKEKPFSLLLESNFVGTPSAAVVKKSVAEKVGFFDADCKIVEDLDFFFKMATLTDFVIVGSVLFYKHTHNENMSSKKIPLFLGHRNVLRNAIALHERYIRESGLGRKSAWALAKLNYEIGELYFEERQRDKAFTLYLEALKSDGNVAAYLWVVLKKVVRVATFDVVSRRTWNRLLGIEPEPLLSRGIAPR